MRVRLTVEVDDRDRYVIAKYFGDTDSARATRSQTRGFVAAALRSAVREHGDALRGRQRAVVVRLASGESRTLGEELREPSEKQLSLLAGVGAE